MNEPIFSSLFSATKFKTALTQILTIFSLAAVTGLVFIVFFMFNSGQLIFYAPMDGCFGLFINPEHSIAHLFDTSHLCWAGLLGIMFIFAITEVMLADVPSGPEREPVIVILLLFAFTAVMMFSVNSVSRCISDEGSTRFVIGSWIAFGRWGLQVVMVLLLFAFTGRMFDLCTSGQDSRTVMVMLLPFAYRVVMILFLVSIADTRGYTSGKDIARMSVRCTWIALVCWAGLLVVMIYLFATEVMLADVPSGQKCRTVMMMPLHTAVVITYMFSISTARGCTSGNDFTNIRDGSWLCVMSGIMIVSTVIMQFYAFCFFLSLGNMIVRPNFRDARFKGLLMQGMGHNSYGEVAWPNDLLYMFPISILGVTVITISLAVLDPTEVGEAANPFATPLEILPEWFLYPTFEILRVIPNKLIGITSLAALPIGVASIPFLESFNRFQNPCRRPLATSVFIISSGITVYLSCLATQSI